MHFTDSVLFKLLLKFEDDLGKTAATCHLMIKITC